MPEDGMSMSYWLVRVRACVHTQWHASISLSPACSQGHLRTRQVTCHMYEGPYQAWCVCVGARLVAVITTEISLADWMSPKKCSRSWQCGSGASGNSICYYDFGLNNTGHLKWQTWSAAGITAHVCLLMSRCARGQKLILEETSSMAFDQYSLKDLMDVFAISIC